MQNETVITESPEAEVRHALSGYISARIENDRPGCLGVGFHGFIVTEEPVKRGYGLKTTLPTHRGYIKGDSKTLTRVENVFDGIWSKIVPPALAQDVVGQIEAATHLMTLGLSQNVKSIWIGCPRIRLSQAMATGFAGLVKSEFKDSKGVEVPYLDVLKAFLRLWDELATRGVPVTVENVEETNMGYLLADANASLAMLNTQGNVTAEHFAMGPPEGYWNHDHKRHPLLSHPRIVFCSNDKFEELPPYIYTMDYEKTAMDKKDKHKLEIEVGQNLAHARYAVVKPHELDPLVNAVARRHSLHHKTKHANQAILYLTAVFSKAGHAMLERFGADVLVSKTFLTELLDGRGVMYSHDMPIPRRSNRAAQVFVKMEDTLKAFENAYYANPGEDNYTFGSALGLITATLSTDVFCKVTEDAKGRDVYKPNPLIETPNTTTPATVKLMDGDALRDIDIKLTIGYDMPARNTVAALLDEDFKAYILVYRDTDITVRHLTVLMSSKGNGIWTTPFAARTFLPPTH